ncbi:predicted protein [Scheffersomyces stipitis CBS 6054]|uniref:Uncharacterized protein n=1 Tax=Scheffersomyces stipitis (strain ATCC 58785 / CBS 6054 / NBRC 10063 / NRRL Y-11545) TaxID=322104 RepID=A3LTV0_PICST|nr:predicted protein [Scheffersomyces stipitis CBS 6054]ABN66477.2 predicted protein [Scheffersomyces stipitis CBS 6054]
MPIPDIDNLIDLAATLNNLQVLPLSLTIITRYEPSPEVQLLNFVSFRAIVGFKEELHSHKVVSSNQVSFDESIYPFENSPDHAPTTSASTIPMGVSGVPRISSDVATTSRAEHISSDEHETSSSDHSRAQSPDMHREDSPATPVSISHNLQPLHSSPAASLSSYDSTDSELARMPSNLLASDSTGEDWKQEKESAINEDDKESEI